VSIYNADPDRMPTLAEAIADDHDDRTWDTRHPTCDAPGCRLYRMHGQPHPGAHTLLDDVRRRQRDLDDARRQVAERQALHGEAS
jgi:hypothetical protein